VRADGGVAGVVRVDQRDVVAAVVLLLQAVVVDVGVLGGADLRHRVGEGLAAAGADVALDHADLGAAIGDDQRPREARPRCVARGRHVHDVHGDRAGRVGGDVDERPVADEGGVQRRESLLAVSRAAAEVLLEQGGVGLERSSRSPSPPAPAPAPCRRSG
jgi:hypothetical protein